MSKYSGYKAEMHRNVFYRLKYQRWNDEGFLHGVQPVKLEYRTKIQNHKKHSLRSPTVKIMSHWSQTLNKTFRVPTSMEALAQIDRWGGIDNYLLNIDNKLLGQAATSIRNHILLTKFQHNDKSRSITSSDASSSTATIPSYFRSSEYLSKNPLGINIFSRPARADLPLDYSRIHLDTPSERRMKVLEKKMDWTLPRYARFEGAMKEKMDQTAALVERLDKEKIEKKERDAAAKDEILTANPDLVAELIRKAEESFIPRAPTNMHLLRLQTLREEGNEAEADALESTFTSPPVALLKADWDVQRELREQIQYERDAFGGQDAGEIMSEDDKLRLAELDERVKEAIKNEEFAREQVFKILRREFWLPVEKSRFPRRRDWSFGGRREAVHSSVSVSRKVTEEDTPQVVAASFA